MLQHDFGLGAHLDRLSTSTKNLRTCLESTERAVSEILKSTRTTSNSRSPAGSNGLKVTPPRPVHNTNTKNLRKVLHRSHARFKRLIIAQHQEILSLRKSVRANNATVSTPTARSTNTTTTPPTAVAAPSTAVTKNIYSETETSTSTSSKTLPIMKTPTKQSTTKHNRRAQHAQEMRKRVITLLKRHRTLSSRLSGNQKDDASTLSELRSITAGLADMGIDVPLTGPNTNMSNSSLDAAAVATTPSYHAGEQDKNSSSKHFEYLFAKIMSGPAPDEIDDLIDESLSTAIKQQLFVATPSPTRRRRRAKVVGSNGRHPPTTPTLLAMVTPPRYTNSISPRNPTPGSRKRARIERGEEDSSKLACASDAVDVEEHGSQEPFASPFTRKNTALSSTQSFVPTILQFSSPSSSYDNGMKIHNTLDVESMKVKLAYNPNPTKRVRVQPHSIGVTTTTRCTPEEKQEDTYQQRQQEHEDVPPCLFISTPNRKTTKTTTSSRILQSSCEEGKPTVMPVALTPPSARVQYQSREGDTMIVGSPFPPMSPILEPVDRSAVFATLEEIQDDIDLDVVVDMIGGTQSLTQNSASNTPVTSSSSSSSSSSSFSTTSSRLFRSFKTRSDSTPVNARVHIPFIDARPHRSSSTNTSSSSIETARHAVSSGIPRVRRVGSPRLSNHQHLRSSIRLARKSVKNK